ncbi:hypothetical protein ACA040_002548 [Xenophilus aerolatus]
MSKKNAPTFKRSKEELLGELAEQIRLLVDYCAAFDAGRTHFAKPISTTLQILLYGTQGRSLCLLHQLGLRQERFYDTAPPLSEGLSPQCQLAAIHVDTANMRGSYVPMLSGTGRSELVAFSDWWNTPVVRDAKARTFSRLEIVKTLRDQDGGAHLDGELLESFADFKSGAYSGWKLRHKGELKAIAHPHLACIRQIAHETILSIERLAPQSVQAAYSFPIEPSYDHPYLELFDVAVSGVDADEWRAMIQIGADLELVARA